MFTSLSPPFPSFPSNPSFYLSHPPPMSLSLICLSLSLPSTRAQSFTRLSTCPPPSVPTMMQPPCMTRPILFPSPLTINNLAHVRMKTTTGKIQETYTQNKQTHSLSKITPSFIILLSLSFYLPLSPLSLPFSFSFPASPPLRDSFLAQISQ